MTASRDATSTTDTRDSEGFPPGRITLLGKGLLIGSLSGMVSSNSA